MFGKIGLDSAEAGYSAAPLCGPLAITILWP
jgi:hypothetical protein